MDERGRLLRKRYNRLELIGQGGMASVYRGRDEALGRDVAIKMYPPAKSETDARRQEAEVSVVAGLSHHGLVTLFDAGMVHAESGTPQVYLVMELVSGVNLQQMLAANLLSARDISYIGHDVAEALQYVHHNGVVHRDIKPSNILMVDYGDKGQRPRAKVTDFGIARTTGAPSTDDAGATSGTAAYVSPEQVRRTAVGSESDIYSLGLVLLECFTRELAFPGTAIASALSRLERSPVIPDDLPTEWRRVLLAMTSRDPAARPTAAEVTVAMRDLTIDALGRHREVEPA
jgi:serine/threonine protein kinase